jgi:hypothetical protein
MLSTEAIQPDAAQIASRLFDTSFAPDPKLSLRQINACAETVHAYTLGVGIHSAFILGNASALNKTSYPTGKVIHFKPEAKVDTLTLSPESVHALVVCKVIAAGGQTLNDDLFKSRLEALEEAVPQYAAMPISSDFRKDDNTDEGLWSAELGDTGSAGVLVKRSGASSEYYVQANCTVPVLGAEFISALAKNNQNGKHVSWEQLMGGREFAYWKQATIRQACRLAYAVAEKLGVGIATINEDATYKQTADQADRVTANPTYVQWISCIEPTRTGPRGQQRPVVSQFIQCASVDVGRPYHFVSLGPSEGFAAVKIPNGFQPVSGALPTTTGRIKERSLVEKQPWDSDDAQRISSQCTWEGKGSTAPITDRLHPAAFRTFDDVFVAKNFEQQGWVKEGKKPIEDFHLVTLKIAAPKARPGLAKQ